MSLSTVKRIYDNYAWAYDVLFGRIFGQGRHYGSKFVNLNADKSARVLEVGVGTGLSLPLYRSDLQITGIDISEKMLAKAKQRVRQEQLTTSIDLMIMDAENVDFADDSFDFVIAMYVASVVPNLDAFLNEVSRVCKPGGQILIINHFASEQRWLSVVEQSVERIQHYVGFNANLSVQVIHNHPCLDVVDSRSINFFGYWKVLHCQPKC